MTVSSLVEELLADQQSLTAAEQFSRVHDERALAPSTRYRNLIPLQAPAPGEQYAFEVELDKCSGCKACVTACHSLNGLDHNETWREVGLLIPAPKRRRSSFETRNTAPQTFQHVTTACHHCIDPACLNGCPVLAYEKDSVTGIVRHLDDQCIGCQYCVLKCPYDVPKYNPRLGIVRKCDMCANRLAVGEAPACVQACPNEAIRITKIQTQSVTIEFRARKQPFLPGAPAGDYTLPTTVFVAAGGPQGASRQRGDSLRSAGLSTFVAADAATLRAQPAHWPLVLMLVLSQAAIGVCGAAAFSDGNHFLLLLALALGVASIAASVFHLGRPLGAWRFFLGLKRSWLSREILALGIFVSVLGVLLAGALTTPRRGMLSPSPLNGERAGVRGGAVQEALPKSKRLDVPTPHPNPLPVEGRGDQRRSAATAFTAGVGLLGVFCSVMIYHVTRRTLWHWKRSAPAFFGSVAVLGAAAVFALNPQNDAALGLLVTGLALKLLIEICVIRHVTDCELTSLKKTALLVTGRFQHTALVRVLCAVAAMGVALLLNTGALPHTFAAPLFILALAGEILERLLFFCTVDAPKMPGGWTA